MRTLRTFAFIAALIGLSPAAAQQFPTVPDHTVIGRVGTGSGSGPSQAIPFANFLPSVTGVQSPNTVFAGPNTLPNAVPAFRALVGTDLPAPGASSLGGVKSLACSSHNWFNSLSTAGALGCSQPSFADLTSSLACSQTPALTGDVTTSAGACATSIAANAVTNAKLATMAAWTFKANNTSGSTTPTDVTIDGLTLKASPAPNDEIPLWDSTASAMKKATVATIVSSGSQSPVLLNTLSPSNQSTVSDTTSLTSTYSMYEVVFENLIPATAAQQCLFQVISSGVQSTSYVSGFNAATAGGAFSGTTNTTAIVCGTTGQTNAAPGISGRIRIHTPSGTSAPKQISGELVGNSNTPASIFTVTGGYWNSNGAVTGFQISFTSGNITSGTIKVYGYP